MDPELTGDEDPVVTPEVTEGDAQPSMLDAINAALAPTIPPEDPADAEDPADEEEEGDEDIDLDAGNRRADGTFKSKAEIAAEAAAPKLGADGKPLPVEAPKLGADGKPLPVEPPKKADPVNDPIPDDVKGRTRERMTSLISAVKEKDEMIGVQNQLFDSIKSTGASPEEFGAMLGYMRWVHSDKPEDLKQARELLMHELRGVSLKLGEAAPGVDFIADHPDLKAAVDNGQMTMDAAQELAISRTRTKVQTEQTTAKQTQEQTAQAATKERNDAIADLDALGQTLRASDPDFDRKHAILQPVLQSLGMLPPSKWKAAFQAAYKAIPAASAAAPGKQIAAKPGQQPLRANKSPSGDSNRAPTSMLDAVSAAIDAVG